MISGVAAFALAGCGDNSNQCGPGTSAVDGFCVPSSTCGPGTVDDGTGACVPDGSVICSDGTVFDTATGTCVPDDSVCGPGTVLVDGHCIDEGIVDVDAEEAPEPNDGDAAGELAGQINVPAIGADGFVIHGCVNPYRDVDGNGNHDADFDYWVLQVTGPTALHITADGVSGLAAGFLLLTGDDQLFNDGWQRFGVNLANDKSERDVFLPKAGVYVLAMTDSRSLFLDAAGGPDACYYTTISQIALPAATPGTITDTTGSDNGALRVISFDPSEGDIFDNLFDDNGSDALAGAIVAMKNGAYFTSAVESAGFFGPTPAETLAGGLKNTDALTIVIDPLYNYGLTPQPYTLVTTQIGALALPTTGTSVTVTPDANGYFSFLYFDVTAAGEIQHFDMTFTAPADVLRITDATLSTVADIVNPNFDPPTSSFSDEFVRFLAPGRYYVAAYQFGTTPADTWDLTNTTVSQTASPLAVGTPVVDAALPTTHSAFYSFDPGTSTWLNITGGSTNGGAQTTAKVYLLAGGGWLDGNDGIYSSLGQYNFASAGGDFYEHIFLGDPNDYLLRIETSTPGATTTYDADIEVQDHVDLGTITAGTPINRTGDAFVAGDFQRYLGTSAVENVITAVASPNTATPNVDLIIASLDPNVQVITSVDDHGNGTPETLGGGVNQLGWMAIGVARYLGGAATIDLDVTAEAPRPYTITPGSVAYTEICPSQGGAGTVVTMFDDGSGFGTADEGLSADQTLPFAFELFGTPVTDFLMSTNGFIGFNTLSVDRAYYSTTPIPDASNPNGLLAPFWKDLENIEACRLDGANSVTLEWRGVLYSTTTPVEFQIVMRDTNVVDFIYGAGHGSDGATASNGAETLSGSFGHQITDLTLPSTSQTLTPM